MTQPVIAVLGLGIMGRDIALNYLNSGYELAVWNRSHEKTKEFEALGATVASTPAEATQVADIVFDVTANDESSRSVFCDDDGILSVATPEQSLITCATLSLDWTLELAQLCAEQNLTFFDMPMTGSRAGAEGGALTLLIGGDQDKFHSIQSDLEPISAERAYFGEAGNGMKYKLILNAIQAAHVIAFGDAMRQAKAVGLDSKVVGENIAIKPGGYPTQMSWNNFQLPPEKTNFSVKWILKDLKYAKAMLDEHRFKAPVSTSILDVSIAVLQKAEDEGHGDEDWTIVNAS